MSIETIRSAASGLLARTNDNIARAEWTSGAIGKCWKPMDELDHARGDVVSSAIQWLKEERFEA